MAATRIDLRLSKAYAPRPFDDSRVGEITIAASDEATTGTNARALQTWRVARVHLTERLGELFRCEVLISRVELPRNDPSVPPPPQNTVFDDISNALDDGSQETDGLEDDLQSVDDNLDKNLGGWGSPAGVLSNIGAITNAINQASRVATQTVNTVQNNWQNQNVEQYLLGIPPATAWTPETPPRPGVFLGKIYSVLITRNGQGGAALAGRWVSGLVTEFEDLGVVVAGRIVRRLVRLVIEPQLARLALRTNYRIFEQHTAMQIVKEIFDEAGVYGGDFTPPGLGATRPWCIQYGETDLDFVMRLFSEEGVVPVFECQLGAERMKLVVPDELQIGSATAGYGAAGAVETLDSVDMPRAIPNELVHGQAADAANEEVLWDFGVRRTICPTGASVRSTDFSTSYTGASDTPTHVRQGDATTLSAQETSLDLAFADATQSDLHFFPGRTSFDFDPTTAVQTDRVDLVVEAQREVIAARAGQTVGRGRTNAVGLSVGQQVQVTHGLWLVDPAVYDAPVSPLGPFVVTGLEVVAQNDVLATTFALPPLPMGFTSPARPLGLEAIFEAIPSAIPFLPARRRPPRVDGVHTAITRASASEWADGDPRIGVDPIGRLRASLPWDRRPFVNGLQPLSPPIRATTPWAGHAWGTTFLPREGMELLLAYLDGDPTQPIALGCVHGFVNPAPRERPHIDFVKADNRIDPKKEVVIGEDEKRLHFEVKKKQRPVGDRHLNAIRTAIHPAPKEEPFKAFHELSFDDTPGRERVRLHSSGVLYEEAVHDQRTWVGRDQMNVVQGRQTERVGGNATLIVEGDRDKVVTGHEDRDVKGRQDITVKGTKHTQVLKNLSRWVGSKEPSLDLHRVGLEKGSGVLRTLVSKRDRKTKIQGDDERIVGGNVDVSCGGTYELGGAPLDMKSTAASASGGAGLSTDNELGQTTLDGAAGSCELVADGKVEVEADTIDLDGAQAVRFECGEVSLELSPGEVIMKAPGGVAFYFSGRPTTVDGAEVPATTSSLEMEAPGGAIVLKLGDHTATRGGRFVTVLRPGKVTGEYADAEDALEGGPGAKVAPVDSFQIQGGKSAFKCRRVEMQREGGPKEVLRDPTQDEKDLLAKIGELKKKIEDLEKKADEAVEDRDAAREEYLKAAAERKDVEARIKEDDGIDEELAEAIDRVTAAEKGLQKANQDERRAKDDYDHAVATGQNTDDEEEALEEAKDKVEEAKEELEEAEEELEETREEHGGLMDEYVAAREKEEEKAQALHDAQGEVVRAYDELRAAERELADCEREAAELELFDDEEQKAAE